MNETTSTNRVPAGVPTGGQFAASAKAESAVSLGQPGGHVGSLSAQVEEAAALTERLTAITGAHRDRLQCVETLIAAEQHGIADEAEVLVLVGWQYDSDQEHCYTALAYDADGEEICSFPVPGGQFHSGEVPADLRYRGENAALGTPFTDEITEQDRALTIDLAAVRAVDVEAETAKMRDVVAHAALDPSWQALVLSPSVVRDQIAWETDQGLSERDKDEVVRRFMAANDPRAASSFVGQAREAMADEFHADVRRLVEDVLDGDRCPETYCYATTREAHTCPEPPF